MEAPNIVVQLIQGQKHRRQIIFNLFARQLHFGLDELQQGESFEELHDNETTVIKMKGPIKMTCESKVDFLLECFEKANLIVVELADSVSVVLLEVVEANFFDGDFLACGQKYTSVDSAETALANSLTELII